MNYGEVFSQEHNIHQVYTDNSVIYIIYFDAGYNTTRIRREKILSESTLTYIRNGKSISTDTLAICRLTGLPVEDLIEYQQDTE